MPYHQAINKPQMNRKDPNMMFVLKVRKFVVIAEWRMPSTFFCRNSTENTITN